MTNIPADRKTRGKRSKVDLLPTAIKAELDLLLRDKRMTQKDILAIVNALVDEAGLSEEQKLSPAGVNRYAAKMETVGNTIRHARETAEMWVQQYGSEPTSDVTRLLMEMVRTEYFKLLMDAQANPDNILDSKTIANLTLGINRLERAALLNMEKEKQIKKDYAEEVGKNIDKTAQARGLTKEEAQFWREQVLGVKSQAS